MLKKKNDMKTNVDEDIFKEEVPDEELHSKVGVDDHIYVERKSGIFGGPVLIFLAVSLALTALLSTLYGLLSLDNGLNRRDIGVITSEYHLTVIHSDDSYGGTIKSFKDYNTSNKYFSYSFDVTNKNSVDLNYSVAVSNNSNVDISNINYELVKNDGVVKSGKLSNIKSNKIYGTTSLANTTDKYEIRFWSDSSDSNDGFTFKIEILV